MFRTAFITFMLLFSGQIQAQDTNLQASVNRALGLITIAIDESESKEESNLELTDYQKTAIQDAADKYSEMLEEGAQLPPESQADPEIQREFTARLAAIESNLTVNVLLPHQLQPLLGKVFSRCVEVSGGDTLKAIVEYYPDKIELDEEKERELATISKSTKGKIAKAKQRFEAEVKKILADSETATRKLFTGDEKKILGEPQD